MRESMQTTSKLFSIIFDTLSSMNDHEIDLLIEGKAVLRVVERNRTKKGKSVNEPPLSEAIYDAAQKLTSAESREAADGVLASINQPRRKDFLIQLAKFCGVRVESKDNITLIEQKLVENVVGARLDSEAIKKVAF